MSNIGNLSFSVHLQDMTDTDIAKIKQKLQNLSLSLNIDGNNIKVSNADVIKKQIENAVKSVVLPSVKIDTSAVKQQIEASTQGVVPQIRVSLLKDNLTSDIQSYLNTKSFDVKISVLKTDVSNALKNIGSVTVPVSLKVDKKIALDGLKKSLLNMSVPIGVRIKSSKDLVKDIQERMKNTSVKVGIDVNKNVLRSNVTQALKGQTFKANLDLVVQKASVQQAIRAAFAQAGLKYNTTASDARQNLIDTRTMKASAYADAQKALADLRRAQLASAQAANKQGSSMQRATEVAERQKGVFATLRENVANAYAVYRVGRFLNTAMRIGGEFQQQHIALQTIIGDADKANALFERIKNLAVESPFKMIDLSKYTKQLAAFSIPYEELYDTLKRFGDLSAGLGVDMGRIILAYGQVRSAEFLKGTELRQFTEAGIPLVTELAKKYTELRGTLVSVGDVYDMISKKQVPFSDVKDVLWDLTSEGGKFFNMQPALTDTLKGKLDKLADSYEIFLSEIANSNNDVLGGTLDLLADTLKHWELIQDVVMSAVAAYGTYKATLLAVAAVQKTAMMVEGLQKMIVSYQFLHNTTKAATVAQLAFNTAAKANPYMILAAGLATIAASMGLLFKNTDETAEATAKLNAKIQEEGEQSESTKRNADRLASTMANEKSSIDKRTEAYNKLGTIYPTLFENMTQEQAMLLKEAELRGMVAEAAKKETKEKLEASLAEANTNVEKAQKNVDYWSRYAFVKNKEGKEVLTSNKSIKKDYEKALADLVSAQNLVTTIQESIEMLDKKAADQAKRVTSRWFKEAQDYVNSLPAEYKGLMPEESEEREGYFERIGKTVDNLNGKIKELDKNSSAAQEVLGGYTTERDYANNIYTKILGGIDEAQQKAIEDARKKREEQTKKNEKERKDAAKRLVQAYADALKTEIAKVGSQWNLFKDLLEATGNESVSMNLAFGGQISFKNQLEQLEKMIDDEIKKNNLGISVSDLLNMSEGDIASKINSGTWGEDLVKNLTSLTDAYRSENEKVKEESIRNFIDIVKNSNDFAQQIENIERKLQKDLNDLRANAAKGGLSKDDLERMEAELTARAEEEKSKVRFDEFKKSSDWVKVFDDLDRVSDATLENMISKIEEFARQAGISEEVTKQLVDAMAKLREETIDRNPFKGFADAWERLKNYKTLKLRVDEYDEHGKLITQKDVDDGVAEANDDLEKAALAIAGKFNAVADAANMLSGVFNGFGDDLESFGGILNEIGSGAKSGAGIASALGIAGPWGAIAGAALGLLSSAFEMHDKAIQKEIEASEARIKMIDSLADNLEKRLSSAEGGIYSISIDPATKKVFEDFIEGFNGWEKYQDSSPRSAMYRKYKEYDYLSKDTIDAMQAAISNDSYYSAQLASLKLQKDELNKQKNDLKRAKYIDETKIQDKVTEIEQVEHEIAVFSKTMMDAIYGIDFKDWASQFTDSIVDAWAKGEDAADAYQRTVSNVMRNVAASVIQQSLIGKWLEDNMENVLALFERNGGVITDDVFNAMAELASGIGGKVEEVEQFMDYWEKALNKYNLSMKDLESTEKASSGLSKGIQSVTEDTANLLASYVNSMRADLSVNRTLIEQLVSVDVPQMSIIAQAQLQQLQQVAANTKRNADAAESIRETLRSVIGNGNGGKAIRLM